MVAIRSLFPSTVCITFRLLLLRGLCTASFDTRQALENIILLCSVGYGAVKIRGFATGPFDADMWMSIGTALLPRLLYMDKSVLDKNADLTNRASSDATFATFFAASR
ncbi:hypothetical protein TRAPUB_4434 [Trametes pubescens]|uniref:Uncharacterized protein n=1 Tax=Trametes pubescens TaxID=154538 RepID=A0A1M2VB98_TRAPU|nr:hypothetical protein TRAPUB_4434 [Trametes pubescens]